MTLLEHRRARRMVTRHGKLSAGFALHLPTPETLEAMAEAERGEYAGELDMSSLEAFIASVNTIGE